MKLFLYGWIRDIAYYTLLMVVVLHVLPDRNQKKYLQFFMGIVLIILVLSPFLSFTGLNRRMDLAYARSTYDEELQDFQRQQEALTEEYETYLTEQLAQEGAGEPREGETDGIPEIHIEVGASAED